jgi:hypothetical protein
MRSLGIQGLLKRALPFIATFGVALLVTSFFVDIRFPRFGGRHRHQDCRQMRVDFERMKAENERMRVEMEYMEMRHPGNEIDIDIPAPPMPPLAPMAPHSHK